MSTAGRFVLENQKGEVVRTFSVDSEKLFLIYNQDSRRVVNRVGRHYSHFQPAAPTQALAPQSLASRK